MGEGQVCHMDMGKDDGSLLGYHHLNILQNVDLLGWSVQVLFFY